MHQAIACAAAIFISSVIFGFLASNTHLKSHGKASTLFT